MPEVARKVTRAIIQRLEDAILEMPQIEIKTTHHFSHGIYAREIFIPKGALITGKVHKTEHLNIVSKGRIAVVTEFGEEIIEAPATIVSQPGTKRVGLALEDTVWTTIHGTHERDLDKLETELIAPSVAQLESEEVKWLG